MAVLLGAPFERFGGSFSKSFVGSFCGSFFGSLGERLDMGSSESFSEIFSCPEQLIR